MESRLLPLLTVPLSLLLIISSRKIYAEEFNYLCNASEIFNPLAIKCAACDGKSRVSDPQNGKCVCAKGYAKLFSDTVSTDVEQLQCVRCANYGLIAKDDNEFCVQCSTEISSECQACKENEITVYNYDYDIKTNESKTAVRVPKRNCIICPPGQVANTKKNTCVYCHNSICFCSMTKSNTTYCDSISTRRPDADTITVTVSDTRQQLTIDYLHKSTIMVASKCRNSDRESCQHLANLCVLSDFNRDTAGSACYFLEQIKGNSYGSQSIVPDLFFTNLEASTELYRENAIDGAFRFGKNDSVTNLNDKIEIIGAAYRTNGAFIGMITVDDESFNICVKTQQKNALRLGKALRYNCEITVEKTLRWNNGIISRKFDVDLRDSEESTIFYELYLRYRNTDGEDTLHRILIINENAKDNQMRFIGRNINDIRRNPDAVFVRRFFIIDQKLIKSENNPEYLIRLPELISLSIQFQSSRDSRIYPPYLQLRYRSFVSSNARFDDLPFPIEFTVKYSMDNFRYEKFLEVMMGSLCSLSLLFGLVKAYSWARRAGRLMIDTATIVKFLLYTCENIANVFFLVMTVTAVWITYTYKLQEDVILFPLSYEQESSFTAYIITAAVLNVIVLLHNYVALALVETFFIDWERPRFAIEHCRDPLPNAENLMNISSKPRRKNNPVVIWRTYLVANKWNELQSYRKFDITIQLLFMLFLLEFLHFGDWAMIQPGFERYSSDKMSCPETRMSRFAVNVSFYVVIFFVQWMIQILVKEKIADPFRNFMDLCSIANISVLTMTHSLHGFYIHGRSVHGLADTDMLEMNTFLQREKDNLCGMRGLENGSELQTFRVNMPRHFRERLIQLADALHRSINTNIRQRGTDKTTMRVESIALAYNELNQFFKNVIDHADINCDYTITDGKLIEAIAGIELSDTSKFGTFTRDHSETGYSSAFLYGNEWTQVLFEMLLFCLTDMATHSRIFACIVTYSISIVTRKIVKLFFTNRLVKSSLVDNRFLI